MTRLDRVLKVFHDYDVLITLTLNNDGKYFDTVERAVLDSIRDERDQLTKELIEHGYQRVKDIISQDIFSEKPTMQDETWCG